MSLRQILNLKEAPLSGLSISSLYECTQVDPTKGFIYNQQTAARFFGCLTVLMELLSDHINIAFTWLFALAFTTIHPGVKALISEVPPLAGLFLYLYNIKQ